MSTTQQQIGWQSQTKPDPVPGWSLVVADRLRDLGTVDISTTVAVNARGDEKQTPQILLTLSLDDASMLAGLLDDGGDWPEIVAEIRKALGLAGCWVDFQSGAA